MTARCCGTCKHWKRGWSAIPEWGECKRSESEGGYKVQLDSPMIAQDCESYHACLETQATGFWCSEYSEKGVSA